MAQRKKRDKQRQALSVRERVWQIFTPAKEGDRASVVFDVLIMALIVLNVLAIVLETVEGIRSRAGTAFRIFEIFSVAVFTVEYLLRLWSCTVAEEYRHPLWGRLRYAIQPLPLIDLLAVLPFYLPFVGVDLRFARALRLFRMFRIIKMGRYSRALRVLGGIFIDKKEELLLTIFVLFILILFAAALMYYAERDAQPQHFSSIPASMWWAVVTLSTVGYGDVYPITAAGKVLAAVIAVLGIGLFALPNGIIAVSFIEQVQKGEQLSHCPHCGKKLEE